MKSPWIDVSVGLQNGMVHWPDNPPMEIRRVKDMEKGDNCSVSILSFGSHTGTHMDAPSHFIQKAKAIDQLPFEAVIGPARVLEIKDPESVRVEELRTHHIGRGERILLKTENSKKCWKEERFQTKFVYLTTEAGRYLAECGILTLGVDYLSVGGYKKNGTEIHQALLGGGIWIIEGLDLSRVQPGDYELICLPLKIIGGDGAPARALLKSLSPL